MESLMLKLAPVCLEFLLSLLRGLKQNKKKRKPLRAHAVALTLGTIYMANIASCGVLPVSRRSLRVIQRTGVMLIEHC
jgi:hypothetical protein